MTSTVAAPAGSRASERTLGVLAVLGATVFWSFGSVLGKATELPGVVLGFWRMWIASALMIVVIVVTGKFPSWADIRRVAPMGALFGLNICVFFITLEYVSIAVALIIGALTPVVALPIAVLFMGERLTTVKVVCAAAAVTGVVGAILASPPNDDGGDTVVGYLWAVGALLIWVAYLLASKKVRREVETVRMMWCISVSGALTVSVLALVLRSDLGQLQGADWLWVLLLASGPGLLGHGLFVWAQPRVDSSVSSVLIQAEPVGASLAAWVFLGEAVSLAQALWMSVVLVALGVLAYREAREAHVVLDDALA